MYTKSKEAAGGWRLQPWKGEKCENNRNVLQFSLCHWIVCCSHRISEIQHLLWVVISKKWWNWTPGGLPFNPFDASHPRSDPSSFIWAGKTDVFIVFYMFDVCIKSFSFIPLSFTVFLHPILTLQRFKYLTALIEILIYVLKRNLFL